MHDSLVFSILSDTLLFGKLRTWSHDSGCSQVGGGASPGAEHPQKKSRGPGLSTPAPLEGGGSPFPERTFGQQRPLFLRACIIVKLRVSH